jgi:20S proteasome subunit beta 4
MFRYGGFFLLGLLDNLYKKDLTLEEGMEIIKKCAQELKTRFLMS